MKDIFEINKEYRQTMSKIVKVIIALSVIGFIIAIVNLFADFSEQTTFWLYLIAYILIGHEIIYTALKNLSKGIVMPNLLIGVATIGAMILGYYIHSIGILLFFRIGEYLQNLAIDRSKKRISSALDLKSEFVNLQVGSKIKQVSPEDIKIGDILIIKVGERVALDGIVIKGKSVLDMSALTGESKPRNIQTDDNIISGSINLESVLEIKVTSDVNNSTISNIIRLINEAATKKSKAETFIFRFTKVYVPLVVVISILILLLPMVMNNMTFYESLTKALMFLVISVPCSLALAIPLAFFIAIGVCSKKGILIKGSNYLDTLNDLNTVVFDKTGTLTKGVFKIVNIVPNKKYSKDEVLEYVALAEYYSNHYIAKSILREFTNKIDKKRIGEHEEIAGFGIKATIDKKKVLVGSEEFLEREKISIVNTDELGTKVHLAINNEYCGCVILSDELKEDSIRTCYELKQMGIKVVMLTGDNNHHANEFGKLLNIDNIYADLLPQDKVSIVEKIKNNLPKNTKVAFIGDGINDAPVLAMSDVGVAMGKGSDIAIETSDIVFMTDEPTKIVECIKVARRTRKIVSQVIIVTIIAKVIFLILTWFGIINLFIAISFDLVVSLLSVLSCIRILNMAKKQL